MDETLIKEHWSWEDCAKNLKSQVVQLTLQVAQLSEELDPLQWKPYPDNKPSESGFYPVTVIYEFAPDRPVFLRDVHYSVENDRWYVCNVIAWKYPTQPYQRSVETK